MRALDHLSRAWCLTALATALLVACERPASGAQGTEGERAVREADAIDGLLSLVVLRGGEVVVEGYFDGTRADDLLHLRSATKSVVGLLVGIAIDRGHLESVHQPIGPLLGSAAAPVGSQKGELTVRHMLTMTAGLDWSEDEGVAEYNSLRVAPEPVEHYLSRDFVAAPGEEWSYSSGASHVLSAVLSDAVAQSTEVFARDALLEPLGIGRFEWEEMHDGVNNGSAGLALTTRDFARIGELMLGRGAWQGRRVVPEAWIEEATTRRAHVGGDTHYGYQWWITCDGMDVWMALGHGGQTLLVVPELDAVVAANARWRGLSRSAVEQSTEIRDFLARRLPILLGLGDLEEACRGAGG